MAGDYAWLNELLAQNKISGAGASSDGSLYDTGVNTDNTDAAPFGGLLGMLTQPAATPKKHVTPNYGQASAAFPSGQPRPEADMFKKYLGGNSWQDLKNFKFK